MSGEIVDTMNGVDEETEEWLAAELEQDDLEHRAKQAAMLASEAIRQGDGDALQGIALCLLAYKRRELDP